jgi:hypothetical protein
MGNTVHTNTRVLEVVTSPLASTGLSSGLSGGKGTRWMRSGTAGSLGSG